LARGRAFERTPPSRAHHLRDRRRRGPAQQLPAGRRVRDQPAARAGAAPQAGGLLQPRRRPGHRLCAGRHRPAGPDQPAGSRAPYAPEVISLYRAAGLNLRADLENLTRHASITADPAAVRSLTETSVPTGRLQVPELDMHTISDQLVPVQQENYYRHTVAFAG